MGKMIKISDQEMMEAAFKVKYLRLNRIEDVFSHCKIDTPSLIEYCRNKYGSKPKTIAYLNEMPVVVDDVLYATAALALLHNINDGDISNKELINLINIYKSQQSSNVNATNVNLNIGDWLEK
jgi:hypothetical protein